MSSTSARRIRFCIGKIDKKLDLAIKLDPATGELLPDDNEQTIGTRQQKGLEEEKFAIDVLECLASSSRGAENKRIRALVAEDNKCRNAARVG